MITPSFSNQPGASQRQQQVQQQQNSMQNMLSGSPNGYTGQTMGGGAMGGPAGYFASGGNPLFATGGAYNNENIGATLQQFSQPYGGFGMNPSPFQGNQQQMGVAAQRQQNMAPAQPMSLEQGRQSYEQQQQRMLNPSAADQQRSQMVQQHSSQLMAQEAAMRQAASAAGAGAGMTLGGGPRNFGMNPSPFQSNQQQQMAAMPLNPAQLRVAQIRGQRAASPAAQRRMLRAGRRA